MSSRVGSWCFYRNLVKSFFLFLPNYKVPGKLSHIFLTNPPPGTYTCLLNQTRDFSHTWSPGEDPGTFLDLVNFLSSP